MSTSVHSHSQFGPIDTSMTAESSTSGSRSRTPQIDQAPRQTESDAEWSSSEDDEEGIFFGQHDPAEEQLLDQLTASQGASPAIIKPAMLSLDIAHSQSSDRTRVKKRDSRDFLRRKTLLLSTQHNPASPRMSPRMSTLQKSSRTSRRVSMTKQPLRELVLDDSESSEEDGTPARSRWLEIPAGSPAFVEEDNTDPSDLTFTFSTFHLSTPPAAPAPAGVTSSLSLPRTSDDSEEEDEDEEGDSDKENIAIPINNASPNSIIPSEPVRRRTETIMIGMDIQEEEEGEHHVLAELNMGGLNIGDFDDPDMDVRGSSESPHVDIIDLGSASSDDGEDPESPSSDLLKSPSIARTTLGSTSLLALTPGSQRSRTPPSTTPAEGDGVTAGLSGTPSNQSELSDSPLPVNRGGPIIIPQISHLTFSMRAESGSPYRDLQMPHFTPPAEPGDHGERGLSGLHMDFMASPSEKQSLQPLLMSTPPPQTEFVQRTDEVPPQSKAPKLSSSLLGVSTRTKALSPRSAKKEKRMIDRKQAIRGQLDQAVAGRTNNMGPPRRAVLSTTAVRPASALGLHSIPDRPPSRSESISSVPPPQKSLTSTTSILKPTRSALPKPKPLGTSIGGPKSLSEPTRIPTKPPVRTLPSYTPLTSSTRAPLVQRTLPPAKATLASKSGKLEPAVRQPPVIAPLQTSVIGTNGAARQMVPVVRTGVNPLKRPITQVHENLGRSAVATGGISRGPLGMSERSAPETSSSLLLAPGPVFSIGSYEPEPLSIAQNTRASRSPGRFGPPARPAATPSFSRTAKTFGTPSRLTGTPGRKRILGTPSRAPPVIYAPTTSEPTKPTTSSASIVPPTDHSLRSHEQREATTRQMSSPVRGSSADHDEVSIMIAQTDSSQQGSSPPAKITRRTPLLDRLAAEEKAEQEEKARQEEKERTEQEKRQEQRRMLAEKARAQAQRELADEELETSRQPSPPILRSNKSPTPSPSKVRSETKTTSPDHPPSTHKAARPKRAIKAPVPAASATKPSMRVGIMGPSIVPNMSEKELRETTKRNTAKNEVYHCAIDRQIIRKTGPRPPSPTSKIRTTADKEEEEKKQGRGERAKRRSGSAAPTADEGSEGEEQEYPTIQRIAWKNVAGEEIGEYVAPPESTRPNKKLKLNSLDTSTASTPSKSRNRTRRVKWDNGLILIRNDGSDLKSLSRTPSCEISQLPPGALRNTTSVELDSNGNVIDGKRPAQQLKRHKVVVTAIFYEGEEPAPFDYAKPPSSTKGKKK